MEHDVTKSTTFNTHYGTRFGWIYLTQNSGKIHSIEASTLKCGVEGNYDEREVFQETAELNQTFSAPGLTMEKHYILVAY